MTIKSEHISDKLVVGDNVFSYHSINKAAKIAGLENLSQLPISLKILCENLLRHIDSIAVDEQAIRAMAEWVSLKGSSEEISFHPSRVLMQDFTGVPAVVDLAAMRDAVLKAGKNPALINPKCKVDLVIDHSVNVDDFGSKSSHKVNVANEVARNQERYKFLKWGQGTFENFRVVPPGSGICHQVNLEKLAATVWAEPGEDGAQLYPDTLVGTDSHTTMVNALGVLGWGVGGIEAEAAMLGQPISMLIPEVIGVKLTGKLPAGVFATDLVLTITNILREYGVVGKFVEFFGDGVTNLTLEERATISNMSPEFGSTCALFPIDTETCNYMRTTGRDEEHIALVEAYAKQQGLWHNEKTSPTIFTDVIDINFATIKPCVAGPKRPQDKALLSELPTIIDKLSSTNNSSKVTKNIYDSNRPLNHGDVVIAAITSCTNTSNPIVLIAAALLAKKAIELGLVTKPWVKTSLAPGSKVVIAYLEKLGLLKYLEQLGFYLVGYGCTTCIGNSGPLPDAVETAIKKDKLIVSSVLSGNRNFEGRIHPLTKANWLASPPLVVAYALAGSTMLDLTKDPLGYAADGKEVYLSDIWPNDAEVKSYVNLIDKKIFLQEYKGLFLGDTAWQDIAVKTGNNYAWDENSSYIRKPSFFDNLGGKNNQDISNAAIMAVLGDSVTTDHISPAGAIAHDSSAAEYLADQGVMPENYNSYGSRRGNHLVMTRGTFANIRLKNEMVTKEGGYTKHVSSDEIISIFDCAMQYKAEGRSLVVIAGAEYGTGSSRDWAAKGTYLLGVKAVLAESFERIHRSNLIGMGVMPLQFLSGDDRFEWDLDGSESIDVVGIAKLTKPSLNVNVVVRKSDGSSFTKEVLCRIDTLNELNYYNSGGILQYVLQDLVD
ncbi:MAG: aconitate hydratase AcnA [Legionellales bacterium]|jgi:aconitate hydratase|nr:aconitate hydratase AcnA [Legionellales bacterium]